ncbi:hypothetical protein LINPERHAP1_LOCUS41322 [Linum perenne]
MSKLRADIGVSGSDGGGGNPDGRIFKRSSNSGEKGCFLGGGGGAEEEGRRKRNQIEESLQRVMYFNCWALS